ncbi:MAG: ComF family protein [Burkholderiaceae bacterium]|nr:ComF family protein [Burkholderiaceae bacterium]
MFSELLARATAALPSQCAVCRAWPSQPLCDACVSRFAQPVPRCQTCALAVRADVIRCGECLAAPPPLDACHAAVSYVWPWSSCVSAFKFGGDPGWAATLATLLLSTPWVEPALERCDLVLPMPLSAPRLRERGFNQALELARRLAPAKADASLLLRIRDTAPQTTLKRAERLRNVKSAFAVAPLRRAALHLKDVVLVDDVMTSGASLFTAAAALRQAGAARVTALVVARTED